MSGVRLRAPVQEARQRLAEGFEALRRRHQAGAAGAEVAAALAQLRDDVLGFLVRAAAEEIAASGGEALSGVALVAHGGYGRRQVAPFSDVDVMIVRTGAARRRAAALAERLLRDGFDAGLELGHSVRTIRQACRLAWQDPIICSSLLDSRFVMGDRRLFERFWQVYTNAVRRRAAALVPAIQQARTEERLRYGETVYLLEPNIKRSRGGLRDAHLVGWIGRVRWGASDPSELVRLGVLGAEDAAALEQAVAFLLWLRNELHFHAGKAGDVLSRAEQLRIAQVRGDRSGDGILAVERFMRDYFRHTEHVNHLAARLAARAAPARRWKRLWAGLFGQRVPGGLLAGPTEILATPKALARFEGNLPAIMEVLELASLYDKALAPETWEAIGRCARGLPDGVPPEACQRFLSILERPARLGELLRQMGGSGLLERFVPEFVHARGLLQFNQYHKYTVDEHCLRAVERATEFAADSGPLGRVYRAIASKRVLHLALLIHDLGKGFPEDHSERAGEIARAASARLGLPADEADQLEFLARRHLLMNHTALRRDTSDEQTVVRFAAEVGSPERLQMLYVMTAADLGAVGPDTWTGWKAELLADLFHQAMQHLAGESLGTSRQEYLEGRRQAVRQGLGLDVHRPAIALQLEALPAAYLMTTEPQQIVEDLRLLARLAPGQVHAQARYLPETQTVQFTVGTSEEVAPGIFHRLTGALSSKGLEILSAQIYTLAEGRVLDRFWVYDPDYAGPPPEERLEEVCEALRESLRPEARPPTFRRIWALGASGRQALVRPQGRVLVDNHTSDRYTIIDVITLDRRGLLYVITRTLFELGYSVWRAKIGTYLDQVVDVFYVTDAASGEKVLSAERLQHTRRRLLEVIEPPDPHAS